MQSLCKAQISELQHQLSLLEQQAAKQSAQVDAKEELAQECLAEIKSLQV